jgi:hypothetical protein
VSACVNVDLSGPCSPDSGLNLFSAAYLGSFNPANVCQNYLADSGTSSIGHQTYSFDLPAGQTCVIVVNEVNANQGCSSYNLQVSGLSTDTDAFCAPEPLTELSPAEIWLA